MTLSEKVAIVTGGGRGLGAGYCRALAADGASVVVADIVEAAREAYAPQALEASAQRRIFKRQETGHDLIGTVLFLCSDASAFITGQPLNVDGGAYMH